MSNLVALFNAPTAMAVPAHLSVLGTDVLKQMAGGLGDGRNRIGLKQSRFRLVQAGVEVAIRPESYLDVIILGASPNVNRIYYSEGYDPAKKAAPACFSNNGETPSPDASSPQSARCVTCPQNERGSKINEGKKSKACSYSKRLAVVLDGDTEQRIYQLDVKALTIFAESRPTDGLYSMSGYTKLMASKGMSANAIVTRLSFDPDASVAKLFFTPQSFYPAELTPVIAKLSKSPEVKSMLEVTADSVDLSGEVSGPDDGGFEQPKIAAPAPAPAPVEAPKKPKPAPAPAPAPEPVAAPPAPVAALPIDDDLGSMLDGLVD